MTAAKPATRIEHRGNGHSYFLDGHKVPGVTTILGDGIPKPALVGWAARTVAEYVTDRLVIHDEQVSAAELVDALRQFNDTSRYPEKWNAGQLNRGTLAKVLSRVQYAERDAAANKGTAVHTLAQGLAQGEAVDLPDELVGHVQSYLSFLDDWDPTDAVLEAVVVSTPLAVHGTPRLDHDHRPPEPRSHPARHQDVTLGTLRRSRSTAGRLPLRRNDPARRRHRIADGRRRRLRRRVGRGPTATT